MRQKAQLACALIRPAQLLVLDEPVVGLDPPSQRLLGELLEEATAAGVAVLLTTHQLAFADGLADRAVMLEEGAVRDQGRGPTCARRAARWAGSDDERATSAWPTCAAGGAPRCPARRWAGARSRPTSWR